MSGNKFFNFQNNDQYNNNNNFVSPNSQQNQSFVAGSMVSADYNNQNMNNNVSGYDPMRQMPQQRNNGNNNFNNGRPDQGNLINESFLNNQSRGNQPMNNNMQRPPQMNNMQPVNNRPPQMNNRPQPVNNMQQPMQRPNPQMQRPNQPMQAPQQPVQQPVQRPVQQPVQPPVQQPATIKPNLNNNQAPAQNTQVAINASKEKTEAIKANNGPNPLDNNKNPIPVNPVADGPATENTEKLDRYMVSPSECLHVVRGMLFKPGTTLVDSANKFRSIKSGLLFTIYFMVITAVLCIVGGALSSIFVKTYSNVLESFSISIDINGFKTHNYLEDLFNMVILNYVPIIIMSLAFYLASFLNSRGLSLGSYFTIINIAFLPFLVMYNLLFRLACVLSDTIGFILLFASFIYTLVLLIVGIGDSLKFDSINTKIFYFVISISVSIGIIFIITIYVFFDGISPFVL